MLANLKAWAKTIRRDTLTLWFCARHPDTPLLPKLIAALLAAYAFSPIDLIPDFIPVLGLLDEAILLPLGIALCIKLTPNAVVDDCRQRAAQHQVRPRSYVAALLIVALWCVAAWACWTWLFN